MAIRCHLQETTTPLIGRAAARAALKPPGAKPALTVGFVEGQLIFGLSSAGASPTHAFGGEESARPVGDAGTAFVGRGLDQDLALHEVAQDPGRTLDLHVEQRLDDAVGDLVEFGNGGRDLAVDLVGGAPPVGDGGPELLQCLFSQAVGRVAGPNGLARGLEHTELVDRQPP